MLPIFLCVFVSKTVGDLASNGRGFFDSHVKLNGMAFVQSIPPRSREAANVGDLVTQDDMNPVITFREIMPVAEVRNCCNVLYWRLGLTPAC